MPWIFIALLTTGAHGAETFEGFGFYLGEPHIHTGVSADGGSSDLGDCDPNDGSFWDIFDTASSFGLDWVAIADHTNGVHAASAADYHMLHQHVLSHDDETTGLVTIPAAEVWFRNADGTIVFGHRNLYFFGDNEQLADLTIDDTRPGTSAGATVDSCDDVQAWLQEVEAAFGPVTLVPHHPALAYPMPVDFGCWNEEHELVVEIYSAWGNSLGGVLIDWDVPVSDIDPGGYVSEGLDPEGAALRFGFIGGTDNHNSLPGDLCDSISPTHTSTGGLTVVVRPEGDAWTRTAVLEAFEERSVYATSGPMVPMVVDYSQDGALLGHLGEDLEIEAGAALHVELRIPVDYEPGVLDVYLVTHDDLLTMTANGAASWEIELPAHSLPHYFFPAVQLDGAAYYGENQCYDGGEDGLEWLWGSPSWLDLRDPDQDGDGWSPEEGDCDDSDPTIHPGAIEFWYDGIDSDCDEADDFDADGDGFQHDDHGGDDCNDGDPAVYPGAPDPWYDGIDSDCAGNDDFDADGDGTPIPQDCDDQDPTLAEGNCREEGVPPGGKACASGPARHDKSLLWLGLLVATVFVGRRWGRPRV